METEINFFATCINYANCLNAIANFFPFVCHFSGSGPLAISITVAATCQKQQSNNVSFDTIVFGHVFSSGNDQFHSSLCAFESCDISCTIRPRGRLHKRPKWLAGSGKYFWWVILILYAANSLNIFNVSHSKNRFNSILCTKHDAYAHENVWSVRFSASLVRNG